MGCTFKAYIVHVGIINTNYGKQTHLSKTMKFKLKKRKQTSFNIKFLNPYKKGIMGISCVKWWLKLHPTHLIPPLSLELYIEFLERETKPILVNLFNAQHTCET
jgi:hypothetical protein